MKNIYKHGIIAALAVAAGSVHAGIIINEIDYDQPGSDIAEFIELYNNGDNDVSLDGYHIDLANGTDSSIYRSILLDGFSLEAGGYFVVCDNTALVMNCDYDFTDSSGWIQNGAPDAIALLSGSSVIDSMAYEGALAGFTEGDPLMLADSNSIVTSLSRLPNGFDSDDNLADFQLGCITPGTANMVGSGDCSTTVVSTVPVPSALWLFGSGLLGLVGAGRRR